MSDRDAAPFFVGYLPTPGPLRAFLLLFSFFLLGMFAAFAFAIAVGQDDPGDGDFRWNWGEQAVTGILDTRPYPVLHVIEGTERLPAGVALLLTGVGKKGIAPRVSDLQGAQVRLKGIAITRGDIQALQVGDGGSDIEAIVPTERVALPKPVSLGRWRLRGEICDGKCLAGAMRPGRGLSHKACANLCLIGGAPPVFVSADPVDGETFFVMADHNGNALSERLLDYTAIYVSIEGEVERRGGILVFKADPASLEVL